MIHSIALVVMSVTICLAISYGLASVGEPQAHWFWCDVMGLCK